MQPPTHPLIDHFVLLDLISRIIEFAAHIFIQCQIFPRTKRFLRRQCGGIFGRGYIDLDVDIFLCVGKECFLSMLCMSLNYLKLLKQHRCIFNGCCDLIRWNATGSLLHHHCTKISCFNVRNI